MADYEKHKRKASKLFSLSLIDLQTVWKKELLLQETISSATWNKQDKINIIVP